MSRSENINIKRVRRRDREEPPEAEDSSYSTTPIEDEAANATRMRVIAVLIGLSALLILIALLSYTSRDEANAELTMREALGVLRGDEDVRVKFETTHNWLGLLGAVIANMLYIGTVGIWALCLPFLMMLWSRALFVHHRISRQLAIRSSVIILLAVSASAFVGTLQLIDWMPIIPREGSGEIGMYLAGVLSQVIGVVGGLLVVLTVIGFLLVFGLNVDLRGVLSQAEEVWAMVVARFARARSSEAPEEMNEDVDESDLVDDESINDDELVGTEQDEEVSEPTRSGGFLAPRGGGRTAPSDEPARTLQSPPVPVSGNVIIRPKDRQVEPPVEQEPTTSVDPKDIEKKLREIHGKNIKIKTPPEDQLPLFDPAQAAAQALTLTIEEREPSEEDDAVVPPRGALYEEEINYKPPTLDLLEQGADGSEVDESELRENARILQEKLETFRIKIENLTVQPGPVVTQYEFVPAAGIKVAQIENLADDIALALKAQGVRIIAPIPGKGTVGIEIPNQRPALVRFSSIVRSQKFNNPDITLPIAMGKTVVGDVYCADLTKMPHLLIAGATGKGKSVGINTIIASLLYKKHPRELKLVIVDPKRVEMNLYTALKQHYLAICPDVDEAIITSPQNAVTVLKSVVEEMQQRFTLLAASGQRNIADYNRKVLDGSLTNRGGIEHRPIPYIVVIIDELADLMMTAGKEVEEPICRLAQLARAVGIHCIVATQRPSVDVVTGLIKANFPARIAYQVASRIDSRTILDSSGAEHLIGNGDMLFVPGNTPKPIRMQNAFISTDEVERLTEWIGRQKGYSSPYMLPSVAGKRQGGGGGSSDDRDPLFEDAARIFITLQEASVSTLQRRLKVGYARAARIVDDLEMAGIVGPPDGAKRRAVLLQSEAELEAYL
jgi:S-DNA-T family DNA segregation ATPase FtsK/SpoIIIE